MSYPLLIDKLRFPQVPIDLSLVERQKYWCGSNHEFRLRECKYVDCNLVPVYNPIPPGVIYGNLVYLTFCSITDRQQSLTRSYAVMSPSGNHYPLPESQRISEKISRAADEQLAGYGWQCSQIAGGAAQLLAGGHVKIRSVTYQWAQDHQAFTLPVGLFTKEPGF